MSQTQNQTETKEIKSNSESINDFDKYVISMDLKVGNIDQLLKFIISDNDNEQKGEITNKIVLNEFTKLYEEYLTQKYNNMINELKLNYYINNNSTNKSNMNMKQNATITNDNNELDDSNNNANNDLDEDLDLTNRKKKKKKNH